VNIPKIFELPPPRFRFGEYIRNAPTPEAPEKKLLTSWYHSVGLGRPVVGSFAMGIF